MVNAERDLLICAAALFAIIWCVFCVSYGLVAGTAFFILYLVAVFGLSCLSVIVLNDF